MTTSKTMAIPTPLVETVERMKKRYYDELKKQKAELRQKVSRQVIEEFEGGQKDE